MWSKRFTRILSQRNALLRALQGDRPTPIQRDELDVWTHDLSLVSDELVTMRRKVLDDLTPLVAQFYQRLACDDLHVGINYEQSWEGDLFSALQQSLDDDRFRGHTTIGPQRDDIALTLDNRDARRQASKGNNARSPSPSDSVGTRSCSSFAALTPSCCSMTSSVSSIRREATASSSCFRPARRW